MCLLLEFLINFLPEHNIVCPYPEREKNKAFPFVNFRF